MQVDQLIKDNDQGRKFGHVNLSDLPLFATNTFHSNDFILKS